MTSPLSTYAMSQSQIASPLPSSRSQVLKAEKSLAAIESQLRSGPSLPVDTNCTPAAIPSPLEALGDAYLVRLAGHRLDNINRALISFQLASRAHPADDPMHSVRLSGKIGKAIFLRLQSITSLSALVVPLLIARAHLSSALDAVQLAAAGYEATSAWINSAAECNVYLEVLLYRGLIYDAMYQTIDVDFDSTSADHSSDGLENDGPKRRLKRNIYISDCIESLEKALGMQPSELVSIANSNNSTTREKSHSGGETHRASKGNVDNRQYEHSSLRVEELQGMNRARAVMCLARAYSNLPSSRTNGASKAVQLLSEIDSILDDVEMAKEVEGLIVDEQELKQTREDAHAQRAALMASGRSAPGRCVVC